MTPRFILPFGYAPRDMELVLSREAKGWRFYGCDRNGYWSLACNHHHEPLSGGLVFSTKQEAAIMARALNLPAYAVWNGRKRAYDGKGAIIRAYPRNYTGEG